MGPLQVFKPWYVDILRIEKRASYGAVRARELLPVYQSFQRHFTLREAKCIQKSVFGMFMWYWSTNLQRLGQILTLRLLLADLANTKWCKNPRVLIWKYSARALQWIPTWQGLNVFQKYLRHCTLDENSPISIGRVKAYYVYALYNLSVRYNPNDLMIKLSL